MDKQNNSSPAIFLDRDGVIIENRADYVRCWHDVEIFPQALDALARLRQWPGKIVIVTNQSVVGRRLISLQEAQDINRRLLREIETAGGRIDAVYMCPHAPDDNCACRKPLPGMLTQAARDLQIKLTQSIMIGDALTDLAAGRAAGVSEVALVRTGHGQEQVASPAANKMAPFAVYNTLSDALQEMTPVTNANTS